MPFTPVGTVVKDWLDSHIWSAGPLTRADIADYPLGTQVAILFINWVLRVLNAIATFNNSPFQPFIETALGTFTVLVRFKGSWEAYVAANLNSTSAALPYISPVAASRPSNVTAASFNFQTALSTTNFLTSELIPSVVGILANASNTSIINSTGFMVTPAQYVDGGIADSWLPAADSDFYFGPKDTEFNATQNGILFNDTLINLSPLAKFFQGAPTLAQVTATSSAEAAFFGSPTLLPAFFEALIEQLTVAGSVSSQSTGMESEGMALIQEFGMDQAASQGIDVSNAVDNIQQTLACLIESGLWTPSGGLNVNVTTATNFAKCMFLAFPLLFAEAAPCSQTPSVSGVCEFPSSRLAGGSYVDDTAVAQTIAQIQAQLYAKWSSDKIRLVITANNKCAPNSTALQCNLGAIYKLFAGYDPSPSPIPFGGLTQAGAPIVNPDGAVAPSPQVFKAPFTKVKAAMTPVPGSTTVSYASLTTETVANAAYGTTEGTVVDLLIFFAGGNESSLIGLVDFLDEQQINETATFAQNISDAPLAPIIAAWVADA